MVECSNIPTLKISLTYSYFCYIPLHDVRGNGLLHTQKLKTDICSNICMQNAGENGHEAAFDLLLSLCENQDHC